MMIVLENLSLSRCERVADQIALNIPVKFAPKVCHYIGHHIGLQSDPITREKSKR